jgi:hypothetical protein
MAAIVILGLGWLYLLLTAQPCSVNRHTECNLWVIWVLGIYGVPLLITAIVILISAAILLVCFLRDRRLMEAEEIKLVSDDEVDAILEVAQATAKRLGWPNTGKDRSTNALLPTILFLKRRQNLNYGKYSSIGKMIGYFSPVSISKEGVVILAPYIDDWLNGGAEYNTHSECLGAFKRRLLSFGAWPDERALKEVKPQPA